MPSSPSHSFVTIRLRSVAARVILLTPFVILAIVGSWFVVHWYIGDTIAEFAPRSDLGGIDAAQTAVKWAPGDPFAHEILGDLYRKDFDEGRLDDAVREYQLAVGLSPNDYRYWLQLGRALEASGDSAGGEKAMRRSIELAPSYSYPRWYLGNLLLRNGDQDQALRELIKASTADPALLPQVFNLTWEIFDGNAEEVARVMCPTSEARIQFALYLAKRKEFDNAIRMWKSANPAARKDDHEATEALEQLFLAAGRFHYALDLIHDLDPDRAAEPEKFTNGGFESDSGTRRGDRFGWVINSSVKAQITLDHIEWHSGHGSLKIAFKSPTNLDSIDVSQVVIVEPNTQYRFECYARTRDLITGGTPVIQIFGAMDHEPLGTSAPLPDGNNEWQPVTIEFRTGPGMEGALVRLARASCGKDALCPIFGNVWYDDFTLQHSSGPIIRIDDKFRDRNGIGAFKR